MIREQKHDKLHFSNSGYFFSVPCLVGPPQFHSQFHNAVPKNWSYQFYQFLIYILLKAMNMNMIINVLESFFAMNIVHLSSP